MKNNSFGQDLAVEERRELLIPLSEAKTSGNEDRAAAGIVVSMILAQCLRSLGMILWNHYYIEPRDQYLKQFTNHPAQLQ